LSKRGACQYVRMLFAQHRLPCCEWAAFRSLLAVAYWGLLELTGALPGPAEAYLGLLMPTVILVSIWLPVSRVLSACYCLDNHCVLKSLVMSGTIEQ
jgi:hypothetical protein